MNNSNFNIILRNLTKTYHVGTSIVYAVKNVNLTISHGQIVGLVGPSGSGKSTLLNLIGALDTPSEGDVIVNSQNLNLIKPNDKARFRNNTVGFVFQNFNLIPVLTTYENVVLPAHFNPLINEKEYKQRAQNLIKAVGLEKQMHQKVNKLSGGQQQRVAIARALINHPKLLLADEPTANLDQESAQIILNLIKNLSSKETVTVIIATHDNQVINYCNRIINIRDGKIIQDELII